MNAPLALISDNNESAQSHASVMPETNTRRTIKSYKSQIARLKKQVKAEERRIALQHEMEEMEAKLESLRREGKTYKY